jgi:hypothetical protein
MNIVSLSFLIGQFSSPVVRGIVILVKQLTLPPSSQIIPAAMYEIVAAKRKLPAISLKVRRTGPSLRT